MEYTAAMGKKPHSAYSQASLAWRIHLVFKPENELSKHREG